MTLQEINQNIAANLDRICQEKGMDKAEFIKDLITHFSDMNYPNVSKETIYQMVNGGRKRNESKDLSPVSFGIEKLHAVSEYLGISIDGFISKNLPLTNNPEIQAVCEYTGLNEEAVKELNKWKKFFKPDSIYSTTISQFLFGFLDKITRYQGYAISELENLISLKNDIFYKIDSMKKVKGTNWFSNPENEPVNLNKKFDNYTLPRKAAKFDIQEFTLDYVNSFIENFINEAINNPSIETDHIKIENSITQLLAYYHGCFNEKRDEIKEGDNYGEHN